MVKRILVLPVLLLLNFCITYAQKAAKPAEAIGKEYPAIGIGAGILSFNGDVGKNVGISSLTRSRGGFSGHISQRVGSTFGFSLNYLSGKLANSDQGSESKHLNFESTIDQASLNLIFHFDNGFMAKRTSLFAPFISAGFGFLRYDTRTDLKTNKGETYYYWKNGAIKNMPESDANAANAYNIQRDYIYETNLTKGQTTCIPVGVGIRLKINYNIACALSGTYVITATDDIDKVTAGAKDNYTYANVSFEYKFGKKPIPTDNDPKYKNVDFAKLDNIDADGDGIADERDECLGTPKGVAVDKKGCPIDTDEDGVPDFKDKEKGTAKGAPVDSKGVTITDKMIAEEQAKRDALVTERSQIFSQNPSLTYLKDLENKSAKDRAAGKAKKVQIPEDLEIADKNEDGYISTEEITMAIDSFFEGNADFTVEKINQLIDFFFEQ